MHRDLKPANIMIDGRGRRADHGLRHRALDVGRRPPPAMTASGVIVGTVEYMAPEQAQGEAVDQRADIYAFGLILNDMLLGRRQGDAAPASPS